MVILARGAWLLEKCFSSIKVKEIHVLLKKEKLTKYQQNQMHFTGLAILIIMMNF